MGEVDPAFIQEAEHRPKPFMIEGQDIPLIDLSPITRLTDLDSASNSIEGLVREIGSACKQWGFFQVLNHGVPLDCMQRVQEAMREFFAQRLEEKLKVRMDQNGVAGYFEAEHTKNVRDWKEVFDFYVQDPTLAPVTIDPQDDRVIEWSNKWPQYPPHLREASEEYAREVEKLAYKLMSLIALSLGLPAKRFHGFFKDHQTSFVRFNHYPPCPSPHLALGVGRHKDGGVLTILAQDDVGGLEVKRKSDGEWIRVKPTPNAYIINVGDLVQVWSNETYESVEHRVMVNSEKERFSIPFFFNPAHYTVVKPLEELTREQNPPKYLPYNWGKFLASRKHGNFKKQSVENLQIYHFKVSENHIE